jgi:hypothetical protein
MNLSTAIERPGVRDTPCAPIGSSKSASPVRAAQGCRQLPSANRSRHRVRGQLFPHLPPMGAPRASRKVLPPDARVPSPQTALRSPRNLSERMVWPLQENVFRSAMSASAEFVSLQSNSVNASSESNPQRLRLHRRLFMVFRRQLSELALRPLFMSPPCQ